MWQPQVGRQWRYLEWYGWGWRKDQSISNSCAHFMKEKTGLREEGKRVIQPVYCSSSTLNFLIQVNIPGLPCQPSLHLSLKASPTACCFQSLPLLTPHPHHGTLEHILLTEHFLTFPVSLHQSLLFCTGMPFPPFLLEKICSSYKQRGQNWLFMIQMWPTDVFFESRQMSFFSLIAAPLKNKVSQIVLLLLINHRIWLYRTLILAWQKLAVIKDHFPAWPTLLLTGNCFACLHLSL